MPGNTFFLKPLPPFRLDLTVWALRRRANNAVDRWDGSIYRRVVPLESRLVELAVTQVSPPQNRDDVGGRNNLQGWLRRSKPFDYASVHRTLARWRPYAGLIYFHLLLDRLWALGSD